MTMLKSCQTRRKGQELALIIPNQLQDGRIQENKEYEALMAVSQYLAFMSRK